MHEGRCDQDETEASYKQCGGATVKLKWEELSEKGMTEVTIWGDFN